MASLGTRLLPLTGRWSLIGVRPLLSPCLAKPAAKNLDNHLSSLYPTITVALFSTASTTASKHVLPHSNSNPNSNSDSNPNTSSSSSSSSLARSNFHPESEASLNRQINTELSAHYLYLAMATYFDRADVALPGFAAYFYEKSAEERDHAILCARYMNKRGGRVKLENIQAPSKLEWKNGLEAMEEALAAEKEVNGIIIDMHEVASHNKDPQMTTFIEDTFFDEQTEDIKSIANYVGTLRKIGPGLGEFEFDFEILRKQGELPKFAAAQEAKKRDVPQRPE